MAVYFPSCVCHLRLRFEEAFHLEQVPDAVSAADLASQGPFGLGSAQALGAQAGALGGRTTSPVPSLVPLALQGGRDNLSQVMNVLPLKATAQLNGYRQAWKFALDLSFRDFPIDPRILRSVGVELHLGAVRDDDFAVGMRNAGRQGQRRSILETRPNGVMRLDTLLVIGTADLIKTKHTDKGSMVHMEGRDLRGILLDAPLPAFLVTKLDLTKPIATTSLALDPTAPKGIGVINQILALHPLAQQFNVEVNPDEWPDGFVPSPGVTGDLTRVRQKASGDGSQNTPKSEPDKVNFWDLITQYCFLVGGVPYFAGPNLRVRPARNLFDLRNKAGFDPRVKTPFKDGKLRQVGTEQLNVRRFVYGRDGTVEFTRRFGGTTVPTVECVSVDTSSGERGLGKLLSARWPDRTLPPLPGGKAVKNKFLTAFQSKPGDANKTKVDPGGHQVEEDILKISVPGIRSLDRLRQIAQDLYEEIGRGEMSGTGQTRSLASYGGTNDDPDLVRLRPGDAMEFAVDASQLSSRPPPVSELTDHSQRSYEQEVQEVFRRVGDLNLARVLVASARGNVQELSRFFRINNVTFDWDASKGADISFDFVNYLEARYDVTPKAPPSQVAPVVSTSGKRGS